ncbi:hypothetical protein E4U16_000033 [Claviceps sp. LM84 group G4]|nr:hypothetical protein E4U16_000033 [Claviceps sp. LM84 group G4]KAG6086512.1 hypothetical protein E4U33_004565 [Claviceps sp. LM78 group G4]
MLDWKDLGEIPDSEDEEGFESQQSGCQKAEPTHSIATKNDIDQHIWDFPDSDNEGDRLVPRPRPVTASTFESRCSSPLSSVPSEISFQSFIEEVGDLCDENTSSAERPNTPILGTPTRIQDESHRVPAVNDAVHSDSLAMTGDVSARGNPQWDCDSNSQALRVAVRYERSLRPRKPIQEHPYLLESAQFSSTWKLHGLRPVKVVLGSERANTNAVANLSPDRAFGDNSQEVFQLSHPSLSDEEELSAVPDGLGSSYSTPLRQSPPVSRMVNSSPRSSEAETEDTSIFDQDLPALNDLLRKPLRLYKANSSKKHTISPEGSSAKKRRRRNIIDSDPMDLGLPRVTSTCPSTDLPCLDSPFLPPLYAGRKTAVADLNQRPGSSRDHETREQLKIYEISDDTESNAESVLGEEQPEIFDSATASENDEEVVTVMKNRIRGVLPASWLRLDQQSGREKAEKTVINDHRSRRASMLEGKRGVARLRSAAPGTTAMPDQFTYSDDDSDSTPLATNGDDIDNPVDSDVHAVESLTPLHAAPLHAIDDDDDDDESAIEDNRVEFNTWTREHKKRQQKLHVTTNNKKADALVLRELRTPARQPRRPRQTKITGHLTGPGSNSTVKRPPKKRKKIASGAVPETGSRNTTSKRARQRPVKLGILDTIPADAPHFLKVAARTARRRTSQGRSDHRNKTIQLASRQDQIDAGSVLNEWRLGLMKQRSSVTEVAKHLRKERKSRAAVKKSRENQASRVVAPSAAKSIAPRKLTKHVSAGGSAKYFSGHNRSESSPVKHVRQIDEQQGATATAHRILTRPAQLETVESNHRMATLGFYRKKKFLDNLYHHENSTPALNVLDTEAFPAAKVVATPSLPEHSMPDPSSHPEPATYDKAVPRRRKRTLPRKLDLSAPQYSRANDPVPHRYSVEEISVNNPTAGKLHGLGPYGTQYTHHFEVFPLRPGAFFHESTLIGGGHLQSCATLRLPADWIESRPHASMTLNTHILRWGSWSAQVSSEFGVVLDFVADQLEAQIVDSDRAEHCESTPIQAMDFLLSYIKGSVSFVEEGQKLLFASRARACLSSLNARFVSATQAISGSGLKRNLDVILRVYDRLLLMALVVLKICRQDPNLMAESFAYEEVLKGLANTHISVLTKLGFESLQSVYTRLGIPTIRDRGIRDDTPAIHSWVMTMRVLELAQIRRGSFWDLLQQNISLERKSSPSDASDAQVHERIWQTMFVLLPLVEFSDSGVLLAGKRHEMTSDGWAIPQALMKQVFQLYNVNSHQAASFNSYCRALVGRCHFLVQEWGWRKCVSVIGLIFDFFGTHQLAHLRNEEVYKSPSFLENLAGQPTLEIEPEDRCFHVFLKLVALAIQKMRDAGCLKDVGNLVARTVPNHNRQHNNDEKVHERDLAALRNHHDLLCVLFWAAPPEYRPSPTLIQHLVVPVTSHKEACLINLRAWNQVARYVIASGEAWTSWKPFHAWRNTFFDQVMQQYHSVASDVALQLAALGKEASHSVSEEVVRTTIAINKSALMEVLYVSARASLDVVRHASDLASATFAMNRAQLRTIFTQFSISPPDLDWGILRTSLSTLEVMLTKIDDFKAQEESQQSESQLLNSAVADDALLALDQELSRSFFSMARCVLSTRCMATEPGRMARTDDDDCMQHIVVVAARISMRFVNGGLIRSSDLFNKSKYQMFNALPHQLDLRHRKYLTLFISTLIQHDLDNFDDVGFNLAEAWVCCLVKPRLSLHYEVQLGQQLHRHSMTLVPGTIAGLCTLPDYNMTRDLFEYAVSSMRKSLRDAGPGLHRTLSAEYSSALKLAMEQMKSDLKTTSQMHQTQHNDFVLFVQNIISLIKTHAADICAVDSYFYQITKEYSPPVEDPQLQVASIVSYGLKLQDGDVRSSRPLFYLLFNNAKFSIANQTIGEQIGMLVKSMANANIKNFILCKMLPAVVKMVFQEPNAFPLLDIYLEALQRCYAGKVVSQELTHEDTPAICILYRTIWKGVQSIGSRTGNLTLRQLYLMRQVIALQNLFWPYIYVLSMSKPTSQSWTRLWGILASHWDVFRATEDHFNKRNAKKWASPEEELETSRLFVLELEGPEEGQGGYGSRSGGVRGDGADTFSDADIETFSENMIQDVRKCWSVTGTTVSINIKGSMSMRGCHGTAVVAARSERDLMKDVYDGTREWCWWWRRANGMPMGMRHDVNEIF